MHRQKPQLLRLRFRIYKVALTADIEKAFLQVGLQPADRDDNLPIRAITGVSLFPQN